ncbi:DUF6482 family protein [Pseudoalteromonas xiamenensis]|uniref:Uncharacterized protein n=1 Tax=Pseudoalteromonas xiamenensis TaxID=882626 RepID=A0A975DEH8_9GAMM|nr:DUF6482 family protein [Pseudoalteromonas xiamenensis]QTH70323.1 hypothetical protein J5O05_09835 [Pseudoalteromonas xiamenensis]
MNHAHFAALVENPLYTPIVTHCSDATHYFIGVIDNRGNHYLLADDNGEQISFASLKQAQHSLLDFNLRAAFFEMHNPDTEMVGGFADITSYMPIYLSK